MKLQKEVEFEEVQKALEFADRVDINGWLGGETITTLAKALRSCQSKLAEATKENVALKSNDVEAAPYRHMACKVRLEAAESKLKESEAKLAEMKDDLSKAIQFRREYETALAGEQAKLTAMTKELEAEKNARQECWMCAGSSTLNGEADVVCPACYAKIQRERDDLRRQLEAVGRKA